MSHFKKYYLSGDVEFNDLGIFQQSLKLRNLFLKNPSNKLNFIRNTLGSYGLSEFW